MMGRYFMLNRYFTLLMPAVYLSMGIGSMGLRADTFRTQVDPLLEKYCIDCHGEDYSEAKLELDSLNPDMIKGPDADRWHEVLNQLNTGEMPPEDEPQPTREERETLTQWLTKSLDAAAETKRASDGRVVFRRLNRDEYNNTLNDLFNIKLDVTKMLPPERPSSDGFMNNGEDLLMSPLHFEYYLKIARLYLNKSIVEGRQPETEGFRVEFETDAKGGIKMVSSPLSENQIKPRVSYTFRQAGRRKKGEIVRSPLDNAVVLSPGERPRGTGIPARQGPKPLMQIRMHHFPDAGDVVIRVKAAALESKNGHYPYLGVNVGNHLDDGIEIKQIGELTEVRATPDKPQVYEFRGRLENLPLPFRNKDLSNRGDLNQAMVGIWNAYEIDNEDRELPRLAVYSVEFDAPAYDQWPPKSHADIFIGCKNKDDEAKYAREIFAHFLDRAYRRPATSGEIERLMNLWHHYRVKPEKKEESEEPAEPVEPVPGIHVSMYEPHTRNADLSSFKGLKPQAEAVVPVITLAAAPKPKGDPYALLFRGNLNVPKSGHYKFSMRADDGAALYLNGKAVNVYELSGHRSESRTLFLPAGWHAITVTYYDSGGGQSMSLEWEGPNIKRQPIPASALAVIPGEALFKEPTFQTFVESIRDVLPAALVSSAFLYLVEPAEDNKTRPLTDHELASRLSYFLWSTMPDAELRKQADDGRLRDANVLRKQVLRMLEDDRSDAFVHNFVEQWLELEALDRVAVDRRMFSTFQPPLQEAMRHETFEFFAQILRHDLSAINLLDSDFVVINPLLARHYGIGGVHGAHFRRIALDEDHHRGGLLTHASVLTGNSSGRDSHPIKRGVWLLKNLLNDPPPPPPPNVPDLNREDPKLSGLPLTEQLKLHREHDACYSCHRKIDPWGILFEQYNAVGQWRTGYRGGRSKLIASDELPDGTQVDGLAGLKRYLAEHKREQFAKAVSSKLLAYALGRSLSFADRKIVADLADRFAKSDFRLRHLIEDIVTADVFMTK